MGPYPARYMRDDFSNGLGWQMRDDFFQQVRLDRHMRGDFFNGSGRTAKKEMSFPKVGLDNKKKEHE